VIVPFLNGIIVDHNWRMIMVISSVVGFLNMICELQFPHLEPVKQKESFDIFGFLLLLFGVGALDIAFTLLAKTI
jgi:hypothetical protein